MHSLVRHLTDFTAPSSGSTPIPERRKAASAPAAPTVNVEAITREAEERGRAEGLAAALAEFERLRAEDALAYEDRLAEARLRWTEAQGEQLAAEIERAFGTLKEELSERISRILLPFLQQGVRQRAVDELAMLLAKLLAEDRPPKLKIHGPADLITEIRTRLGAAAPVAYQANEQADVRVTAGDTVFETELRAWTQRLMSISAPAGDADNG